MRAQGGARCASQLCRRPPRLPESAFAGHSRVESAAAFTYCSTRAQHVSARCHRRRLALCGHGRLAAPATACERTVLGRGAADQRSAFRQPHCCAAALVDNSGAAARRRNRLRRAAICGRYGGRRPHSAAAHERHHGCCAACCWLCAVCIAAGASAARGVPEAGGIRGYHVRLQRGGLLAHGVQ